MPLTNQEKRNRQIGMMLDPDTLVRLEVQAEAVGSLTKNIWAGMVLVAISELPASTALKLLGKMRELKTDPTKRVSDI